MPRLERVVDAGTITGTKVEGVHASAVMLVGEAGLPHEAEEALAICDAAIPRHNKLLRPTISEQSQQRIHQCTICAKFQ